MNDPTLIETEDGYIYEYEHAAAVPLENGMWEAMRENGDTIGVYHSRSRAKEMAGRASYQSSTHVPAGGSQTAFSNPHSHDPHHI